MEFGFEKLCGNPVKRDWKWNFEFYRKNSAVESVQIYFF